MINLKDASKWRWNNYGEYSFVDNYSISSDPAHIEANINMCHETGCGRYYFAFERKPINRKRKIVLFLRFNEKKEYIGIDTCAKPQKTELRQWELEAIADLTEMGAITNNRKEIV